MDSLKLIKSKLSIPLNSGVIKRPRLEKSICEITAKKALMVSAPAGFGKTTLVSESLKDIDADIVWYSLDEYDCDFRLFFAYIINGLSRYYPQLQSDLNEESCKIILSEKSKKEFFYSFIAKLEDLLDKDIVLVLDDFHLIGNRADIIEAIEFILSRMPEYFHIVFVTRSVPEIRLSRLKSMLAVLDINEKDLLFSHAEIEDLVKTKFSEIYNEDLVLNIKNSTGGWAAAVVLNLYGLSKSGKKNSHELKDFRSSENFILEYIDENIFSGLSKEKKEFMIKSSVLKKIDIELCNSVFKEYKPEKILKELVNDHLLTSGYVDEVNTFKYHDLLHGFLLEKLRKSFSSKEIKILYQKTGDYYKINGNPELSLVCYLEGELYDQLADLIKTFVLKDVISFSLDLIHDVVNKVPDEILMKNSDLLYVKSRIYSIKGFFPQSLYLLKNALKLFRDEKDKSGEMNCLKDIGFHYYLQGDMFTAIEYLELVMDKGRDAEYILLEAGGLLLFFLAVSGKFEKAEYYYEFLQDELRRKGLEHDEFSQHWLRFCFTFRYQNDGDFVSAELIFRDSIDFFLSTEINNIFPLILFHKSLCECCLLDYSTGSKTAETGLNIIKERGITDHQYGWLKYCLGENYSGLENFDLALKEAQEALEFFYEKKYLWGMAAVHYLMARIYYIQQKTDSSFENITKGLELIKGLEIFPLEGSLNNLLGIIFYETGRKDLLKDLISRKRDLMTNSVFNRFSFYVLILRSEFILKDSGEYIFYCEKLIQLVVKYKYQKRLMLEKEWAVDFLYLCIANNILKDQSTEILEKFRPSPPKQDSRRYRLIIKCLGYFKVIADNRDIDAQSLGATNAGRILKYLAMKKGTGLVKKDVLMEFLWPDQDPELTKGRFHVEMSKLRKVLEPDLKKGKASQFIRSMKDSYELNPGIEISIDTIEFNLELKKGNKSENPLEHWIEAEKIYEGHLFNEDYYESFFIKEGDYLKEKYLGLLNKIISHYEKNDEIAKALEYCKKYLENDPYEESLYRRMMEFYLIEGESAKIKKIFNLCKKNIENDLDSPLSEKTISLYNSIMEKMGRG